MTTVRIYTSTPDGYRELEGVHALPAALEDKSATVWVDIDGPSCEHDKLVSEVLKLHPLVIEDIYSACEVPKIEDYGEYLYIVMHGVHREHDRVTDLMTIEFDIVIGPNWVFTHHDTPMRTVTSLVEDLKRNPRVIQRGAAFLAHSLIDKLTDHYLPVVQKFDESIQALEDEVFREPSPSVLAKIFDAKRTIQRLRRVSAYQRDILQRLSRGEFEIIPDNTRPFFRDVYDHFVRIADLAESYRELVTATLELYMSVTANRTNEIMRVLAVISTVMLPLTFIAGLYGMNFDKMPELHWIYGYPFAISLMVVVAIGFILYFKRKKWI